MAAGDDGDCKGFLVAAAVGNFDHAMTGQRGQGGDDRGVIGRHTQHGRAGGIVGAGTAVFAAAHVGREAVVIADLDGFRDVEISGHRDASKHRIDGVMAGRRLVRPACTIIGQIADHDIIALHLLAVDMQDQTGVLVVEDLLVGRYRLCLVVAVVQRQPVGHHAPPDRIGHVDRIGQVGDLVLGLRVGE